MNFARLNDFSNVCDSWIQAISSYFPSPSELIEVSGCMNRIEIIGVA